MVGGFAKSFCAQPNNRVEVVLRCVVVGVVTITIHNLGAQFRFHSCCLVLECSPALRELTLVPSFLWYRSPPPGAVEVHLCEPDGQG